MTEISDTHTQDESFLPMVARLAAAGLSVIVTAAVSVAVVVGLTGGAVILP